MTKQDDLAKKLKLGATDAFPKGKLHPTDQGELRMAVSSDGKLVSLIFGKPIAWLAMPPEEARHMAALLLDHASRCEGGKPKQ